jgi:transposase
MPCHKAKIVKKWFEERPHIQLIAWPGNSPDLNPIENVWLWMKVQLRDVNASNIEEWKRKITELWTIKMADSEYLKKLVESMPRRLSDVIKREGGTSKY